MEFIATKESFASSVVAMWSVEERQLSTIPEYSTLHRHWQCVPASNLKGNNILFIVLKSEENSDTFNTLKCPVSIFKTDNWAVSALTFSTHPVVKRVFPQCPLVWKGHSVIKKNRMLSNARFFSYNAGELWQALQLHMQFTHSLLKHFHKLTRKIHWAGSSVSLYNFISGILSSMKRWYQHLTGQSGSFPTTCF